MSERDTLRPSGEEQPGEAEGSPTARLLEAKGDFLRQIPKVILSREEVNASDLDNRDYFLLSLLDGNTTIENVLDICGMPSDEAIALLDDLLRRGIVGLH